MPIRSVENITDAADKEAQKLAQLVAKDEYAVQNNVRNSIKQYSIYKLYNEIDTDCTQRCLVVVWFSFQHGMGDVASAYKIAEFISKKFVNAEVAVAYEIPPKYSVLGVGDIINRIANFFKRLPAVQVYVDLQKLKAKCIATAKPKILLDVATPSAYVHRVFPDFNGHTYHIDEYCGWRIDKRTEESDATTDPQRCKNDDAVCQWFSSGVGVVGDHLCTGLHLSTASNLYTSRSIQRQISGLLGNLDNFFFVYISRMALHINDGRYEHRSVDKCHATDHVSPELQIFISVIAKCEKYSAWNKLQFVVVCPEYSEKNDMLRLVLKKITTFIPPARRNQIDIKYIKSVPADLFRGLLLRSQPEVLVTGDQSLVEALALDKIPFYEMQGWKVDLVRNLNLLLTRLTRRAKSNHIEQFFEALNAYVHPVHFDNMDAYIWRQILGLASEMSNPGLIAELNLLSKYLKAHANIYDWLGGLIKRDLLLREYPSVEQYENNKDFAMGQKPGLLFFSTLVTKIVSKRPVQEAADPPRKKLRAL